MRIIYLQRLCLIIGCVFCSSQAFAQLGIGAGYGPILTINRSVSVQGDVIRAQGDSYEAYQRGNVNFALARQELAKAVDMEQENYLKKVRVYYDRKVEHEKGKMELFEVKEKEKDLYAVRRENAQRRVLDALLKDPEMSGASAERGVSMNKMLAEFYDTPIAYGVPLGPSLERALGDRMNLTPEMLSAIRIQTSNSGGGVSVFRLNQSMSLDTSWWPDLLRTDQYAAQRQKLESQREKMLAYAGKKTTVPTEILDAVEGSLAELIKTFYKLNPEGGRKGMPVNIVRQYIRAEDFLRTLDRDMQRIRDTGHASAIGSATVFDPVKDGKDLPSLVTWLIRSGLTFAPASPGDESTYRTVFTQMRDLYSRVAAE